MAGQETIRDVVIRVALQQTAAQFKAPDMGPQVQAQKKAQEEVVKHAQALTPAMMTAINSPHIQAIKNIDLRMKAEQEAANLIAKDRLKEITQAERIAAFRREKAQEALDQTRQQESANIRAAQAARSLGESSMLAVRGFVLLSASGQKEVEKILHSLLLVQGAVDIYKGMTGVLTGVAQAYRAVAASATAAAAAQRASASAAGGSALGAGLSGAIGGLGVASGVGIPLAIGAGVGLTASALITGNASRRIESQSVARDLRREELDLVRRRETDAAGIAFGDQNTRLLNQFGVAGRERAFDLSEAGVAFGEASSGLGRARSTSERFAGQAAQSRALAAQRGLLVGQGAGIAGELAQARAQRQGAQARLGQLNAAEAGGASGVAFQEQRQQALEQRQTAEKNIAEALERQQQNRIQQLQTQRQSVELAKDQLQAERDRVNAVSRGIGSLNEGELGEAKRIADKVKGGGTVSDEELRFLEQSGAFSEFTQKRREQIGADRNKGGEFDSITGGASRLKEFEDDLRKLEDGAAESSKKVVDILTEIKKGREDEIKALEDLADTAKENGGVVAIIKRIQESLDFLLKAEAKRAAIPKGFFG